MEDERTTQIQGENPQWLGSLVRRGEQVAAQGPEPVFEEAATQWLGSVARRDDATEAAVAGAAWTGSSERSALFATRKPEAAPLPAPVPEPVAPANLHELPGRERIVMGALGMTLRVAA
jgi:hypothetical protein